MCIRDRYICVASGFSFLSFRIFPLSFTMFANSRKTWLHTKIMFKCFSTHVFLRAICLGFLVLVAHHNLIATCLTKYMYFNHFVLFSFLTKLIECLTRLLLPVFFLLGQCSPASSPSSSNTEPFDVIKPCLHTARVLTMSCILIDTHHLQLL